MDGYPVFDKEKSGSKPVLEKNEFYNYEFYQIRIFFRKPVLIQISNFRKPASSPYFITGLALIHLNFD